MVVKWLGLGAFTAEGPGLILMPCRGTRHAAWHTRACIHTHTHTHTHTQPWKKITLATLWKMNCEDFFFFSKRSCVFRVNRCTCLGQSEQFYPLTCSQKHSILSLTQQTRPEDLLFARNCIKHRGCRDKEATFPVGRAWLDSWLFTWQLLLMLSSWLCFLLLLSAVQFSHSVCLTLQSYGLQHTRLPCPSPSPRVCSNSCPSSHWCHPTLSCSVIPFSSCLQSFPASGSFPMSQFFTSGDQNIGASASVLPRNIQDWFPLGLTGLISLQSKGLSKVFSNTTV